MVCSRGSRRAEGGFRRRCLLVALLVGFAAPLAQSAWAFELFSTGGMLTPETISRPPAGSAYSDLYYIPDPGRVSGDPANSKVWTVPLVGGPPSLFAANLDTCAVGGLFLPSGPYWGPHAGKYVTVGWNGTSGENIGRVYVYEPDGSSTRLWEMTGHLPKTPIIAPDGFAGVGGQLIIADGGPGPYAIDPAGNKTEFVTVPATPFRARFGLAFAPTGWGEVGGSLLANESSTEDIFSVDTNGIEELFAEVPLAEGQSGLRHMAFCPPGFIPGYDELLFVSISGSYSGGGTLGDVVALDSSGRVVASLRRAITGLDKFDPRGLYFTDTGELLISDASDPVFLATGRDFRLVPEPCTLVLMIGGMAALAARRRARR